MPLADPAGGKAVHHVERPAVIAGLRLDEVDLGRDILGFRQIGPPAAGMTGGAPEHGVGLPTHPDRQMRLLHRARGKGDIVERDELALELRIIAGPQLDDRSQIFVAHPPALVEGDAEQVKLLLQPARAKGHHRPAARQPVDRRQRLGGDRGMLQRQDRDRAVDADAAGGAGIIAHRRIGMEMMRPRQVDMGARDQEMFRHADHVVTQIIGQLRQPRLVRARDRQFPRLHRRLQLDQPGHAEGEFHGPASRRLRSPDRALARRNCRPASASPRSAYPWVHAGYSRR